MARSASAALCGLVTGLVTGAVRSAVRSVVSIFMVVVWLEVCVVVAAAWGWN